MTSKKSPNVFKICPKMMSLEKWKILTPLQKLPEKCMLFGPKNCCHKLSKVAQSGHTLNHSSFERLKWVHLRSTAFSNGPYSPSLPVNFLFIQTGKFYNKWMWKMINLASGARIWTHSLLIDSLFSWPLDQITRVFSSQILIYLLPRNRQIR